jgi:uncharacterized protein (TIGR00369 family)
VSFHSAFGPRHLQRHPHEQNSSPRRPARSWKPSSIASFPRSTRTASIYEITELGPGFLTLRLDPNERHLRIGGTVSGPSLFTLADYCAYYVILAHIGLKGLTVTTSFHLDFMRKAAPGPLFCTCTILKLGARLVVTSIAIRDGEEELIAQGSCTYSIPPEQVGTG